jgi:hypothetical protein
VPSAVRLLISQLMRHPRANVVAVFRLGATRPRACIGVPGLEAFGRAQGPGTVSSGVMSIVLVIFLACICCV